MLHFKYIHAALKYMTKGQHHGVRDRYGDDDERGGCPVAAGRSPDPKHKHASLRGAVDRRVAPRKEDNKDS